MFFQGMPGRQTISNQTNAAIGTSGKPVRVYSAWVVSGGTAATVKLYNGTAASGNDYIQIDGVISKSASIASANGILFPNGCFASVDANTVTLVVCYAQEV